MRLQSKYHLLPVIIVTSSTHTGFLLMQVGKFEINEVVPGEAIGGVRSQPVRVRERAAGV